MTTARTYIIQYYATGYNQCMPCTDMLLRDDSRGTIHFNDGDTVAYVTIWTQDDALSKLDRFRIDFGMSVTMW